MLCHKTSDDAYVTHALVGIRGFVVNLLDIVS